jgi:hypothetical protein
MGVMDGVGIIDGPANTNMSIVTKDHSGTHIQNLHCQDGWQGNIFLQLFMTDIHFNRQVVSRYDTYIHVTCLIWNKIYNWQP